MNSRIMHWFVVLTTLLTGVLMTGGCASHRVDLAEKHQLKVEHISTASVLVDKPSVWQDEGRTVVYGHVTRSPSTFMVGAGHTHVQVVLPDGGITEEQWVPWMPKWIPFRGPRSSTYEAAYPWVIPPGSAVRVWVCHDEHPSIPGGKVPTAVQAS